MQYIKSLDGLRGAAVLAVMLFHAGFLEIGWVGVQLFFVLSGYLITNILISYKSNFRAKDYFKTFYIRRALRIFPVYYLFLLLITAMILVTSKYELKPALVYLYSYTFNFFRLSENYEFSYAFTHFWSLCVEEQFYFFWPLVVFFFDKKVIKYLILFILLMAPVVRWILADVLLATQDYSHNQIGDFVYWFPVAQFDSFMVGAAIPFFGLVKMKTPVIRRALISSSLVLLVLGMVNLFWFQNEPVTVFSLSSFGLFLGHLGSYQHVWSYTILNITMGLVILYCIKLGENMTANHSGGFFTNRILVEVGKVSYGMYIYHNLILFFFMKLADKLSFDFVFLLPVYLMVVFGVSKISYRFIEQPFLKLKSVYAPSNHEN